MAAEEAARGKAPLILVVGASGEQGRAVVGSLVRRGFRVRALARDGERAKKVLPAEAEIQQGDIASDADVRHGLSGADGVFLMTTYDKGVEAEAENGIRVVKSAIASGVSHLVFSSVFAADEDTNIPHVASKARIEQSIRELGAPATIFRPCWFMSNFERFPKTPDHTISLPFRSDAEIDMLAVSDIGEFVATAFERPGDFLGKAIELAGDRLSMEQVAAEISRATGTDTQYRVMPDAMAHMIFGEDVMGVFRYINTSDRHVDIEGLRGAYGVPLTSLRAYLAAKAAQPASA